ncbi:MAG: bifunctional folylpolyglutamate synthase/dihydrofolate synthase [Bacteroidia bacterium]
MTYQQTLDYLYAALPMYQRQGKSAFKKDLTNSFALSRVLDKPELKLKSIHIAGTNGKGSTAHILSAIYQNNGYKVGLYTSPHLLDFRERIKVNGKMMSKTKVTQFVDRIKPTIEEIKPSFFEITVAMAFDHFAQEEVDIAIIETGLGGRLDSTNIIIPEASIITSIGMDHMDMLGDNLADIAFEKAGIIKHHVPVVVGFIPEEAEEVIKEIAKERHCLYYDAIGSKHRFTAEGLVRTDLKGAYQQINIKTALIAIDALNDQWPCQDELIADALLQVQSITKFRGRWEWVSHKPPVLCDVAHNEEGLRINIAELMKICAKPYFILGFVKDKHLDMLIPLFPKEAKFAFVKPDVVRGMLAEDAKASFGSEGFQGRAFDNIELALKDAKNALKRNEVDLIYIGGSNFIVADLLALES